VAALKLHVSMAGLTGAAGDGALITWSCPLLPGLAYSRGTRFALWESFSSPIDNRLRLFELGECEWTYSGGVRVPWVLMLGEAVGGVL
jgi:hypothetical protein